MILFQLIARGLGVGLLFILLPVIAVLVMPPLVPLLYCFLGALAYVSYREIFLGIGDNRARAMAGHRLPGLVPDHPWRNP